MIYDIFIKKKKLVDSWTFARVHFLDTFTFQIIIDIKWMLVRGQQVGRPEVPKWQKEINWKWKTFFCPLLCWWNWFCLRWTFFFFFSLKLWTNNGSTNQYSCQLFYSKDDTSCAVLSQKCILWERGLVKQPQSWGISRIWLARCRILSSGHRTGKSQFSFQSQRKAMPKNAQTTTQLHSSHARVK